MKVTPITKKNLKFYRGFITDEDARFIQDDLKIIPLGLVADDLEGKGNMAAGAICLRPDDFILNITSFYVSPEYRKKGAGKFLLEEAKKYFGEENMEFNVEFFIYGEEEEGFASFLEACGFEDADPEIDMYLTTVGELKTTKLFGKKGVGVPFSTLAAKELNEVQKVVEKRGDMLPLGGLRSDQVDADVSVAVLKDKKIEYFAAVEKVSDTAIMLSAVYTKNNSPTTLLHMLEKVVSLIADKYDDDVRVLVQPIDDAGESVIETVFEEARDISARYRYVI